jgi:hypothetical protein
MLPLQKELKVLGQVCPDPEKEQMRLQIRCYQKTIENLQMEVNEKEAEIIRLSIELGDQKRANSPYHAR